MTMQDWTGCSELPEHNTVTLTDSRDNNTYTVAKLKDGKCWMTQNLRIVGSKTLTPSDSDVSSNYSLPEAGSTTVKLSPYKTDEYGAYYYWSVATIGGGSSQTICPKNWTLPNSSEASSLTSRYDYNSAQQDPPHFVHSGRYEVSNNLLYSCDVCDGRSGTYNSGSDLTSWWWIKGQGGTCGSHLCEIGLRSNNFYVTSDSDRPAPIRCMKK